MAERPSEAVQDYLKAIHRLGGGHQVVSPNEIATALAVKAPSVTGMLSARRRGVDHLHAQGSAQLTALDWPKRPRHPAASARRVVPDARARPRLGRSGRGSRGARTRDFARLEQAIAAHLGEPLEDPHGDQSPSRTVELRHRGLQRLSDCRAGQTVIVREAQNDNPARLRHWRDLGLMPGATVQIVTYEELDDLFEVKVGGRVIRLGSEGLAGLRGELVRVSDSAANAIPS